MLNKVKLSEIDITGGFWVERQQLNRETTVYAVRDRYEETGRFGAFDFDYTEGGDKPRPHYFWDSDVAKWMESAAFILAKTPDAALENAVEELIDKIEAHQDPCGYFNIYHTVIEPNNRFKDRDHHELYCLGHLIEAAVAYYSATGRDRMIRLLDKYVDYVIKVFVEEKSTGFTSPGHEEIELALFKLYEATGNEKYKDLAMFFLNERGRDQIPVGNWCNAKYSQNHLPVRQQRTAEGHSVRANYLYAGMADAVRFTGDAEMMEACRALFDDMVTRKMYITAGVGSSCQGEAFTVAYDLPNDTAYAETCAAIALAMFSGRMANLEPDSRYADTVERAIYNGIISGISLDGRCFFYENPLEINLADRSRHPSVNHEDRLPITRRQLNFGCSCCPPNVTRLIADIGEYACAYDENRVFVHQYMACSALFGGMQLDMDTAYPSSGSVELSLAGAKGKQLWLRIPGWCENFTISAPYTMQNGYAVIEVAEDLFTVALSLEMQVRFVAADPRVRADAGKVAVTYGPLVYCAEGVDNPAPLCSLRIDPAAPAEAAFDPYFGAPVITAKGAAIDESSVKALYMPLKDLKLKEVPVKLIPYFGFANREESDMRVWMLKK